MIRTAGRALARQPNTWVKTAFMTQDTRSDNSRRNGGSPAAEDLVPLLCRGLMRLAVAAHGIDKRLDDLLGELRQMLRRDLGNSDALAELIDSIDKRIKHVDDDRDSRAENLQREFAQLAGQLLEVKPAPAVARDLKKFQKTLKQRLEDGRDLGVLSDFSGLQAQVLAGGTTARPGLLARLFGGNGETEASAAARGPASIDTDGIDETEIASQERTAKDFKAELPASLELSAAVATEPVAPALAQVLTPAPAAAPVAQSLELDASASLAVDDADASAPAVAVEPSFARISAAICQVLDELLRQIEPPPQATENYRTASEQIARGLNWYELVSTLEQISQVVLAALERDENEFQEFLLGLNQQLVEAHATLDVSRQHQAARRQADDTLNSSVRLEVAQMQVQVEEATELDTLKREVNVRLATVVGAMDAHKLSEQTRQRDLEKQLNTLTERMREMEVQSAAIEERLVEQRRLALLDTLTQLPNRQAYDERLAQEHQRWLRYRRPLALAVLDIDKFKLINDNYGHLAGDKVLRIIAKTLRNRLRKTDFIARFGGEEFVVLMPETTAEEALETLDTIRIAVAGCPFHFREQPLTITLSAGISPFVEGAGPDLVFERADSALYRAKQGGRNLCILDTASAASAA